MKIIFSVTNDISFDQRMERICTALANKGFEVVLVGRQKRNSAPLEEKKYQQKRILCWFEKSFLFYLEYNLRLLLYLVSQKTDVYCAIDLDTALPNYFAARTKGKNLVYDAHEYFTEMEEVVSRKAVKWIWKKVERFFVPKVDAAYTISNGYKNLFEKEYKINFEVIRNVGRVNTQLRQIPDKPIILYQGAVNVGRGLEETISAMQQVNAELVICGKGDIYNDLIELTHRLNLDNKVTFKGYVSPADLRKITPMATIGLTLFTDEGLSNKHSLCNRFFDYYLAGLPQITINYPEYIQFNQSFQVSHFIEKVSAEAIASGLNQLLNDKHLYSQIQHQCMLAREHHNWQNEELKLVKIYTELQKV